MKEDYYVQLVKPFSSLTRVDTFPSDNVFNFLKTSQFMDTPSYEMLDLSE